MTNIIIVQVKSIEGMKYDSDSQDSSERNPKGNPTELDNSEVLNLSCFEDAQVGRHSLKVTMRNKMQGRWFLH